MTPTIPRDRLGEFERRVSRLGHGNLALAVEFNEVSDRLKALEDTQKKKRLAKHRRNWHLQSGGVLQVENVRQMVVAREEEELAKAQRKVERAYKKAKKIEERNQIDLKKQLRANIREVSTW